jgi:hypothetical protein
LGPEVTPLLSNNDVISDHRFIVVFRRILTVHLQSFRSYERFVNAEKRRIANSRCLGRLGPEVMSSFDLLIRISFGRLKILSSSYDQKFFLTFSFWLDFLQGTRNFGALKG